MIKAIFIAPSLAEASYWANQWGYKGNEWAYINTEEDGNWRQRIQGFYKPDFPAYIVGSQGLSSPLWRDLEARGFTVYDGQVID